MSGHIADRAGFLASLPPDDPERGGAEQHARACAPCREALDEGHRLLALLGEARPIVAPAPDLVGRAAVAIEKEVALERRARGRLGWVAVGAVGLVWLLQLLYGNHVARDRRSVAISLFVLVVAAAAAAFTRAARRLVVGAMILVSGAFAWLVSAASAVEPAFGLECTACELVAAALPWLLIIALARRRQIQLDRSTTAAVAAAGALASQAAQLLTCPVRYANPHLLIFHFGGFLLAAAMGALNPLPACASSA